MDTLNFEMSILSNMPSYELARAGVVVYYCARYRSFFFE